MIDHNDSNIEILTSMVKRDLLSSRTGLMGVLISVRMKSVSTPSMQVPKLVMEHSVFSPPPANATGINIKANRKNNLSLDFPIL